MEVTGNNDRYLIFNLDYVLSKWLTHHTSVTAMIPVSCRYGANPAFQSTRSGTARVIFRIAF